MPVVVEPDPAVVEKLHAALPPGGHAVQSTDRLVAWLAVRPEEYVVVLGPSLDLEDALGVCQHLRTARPTVSVLLVRALVDTAVLGRAMQAGAREVLPAEDTVALGAALGRAYELWSALRGPGGAARHGRVVTVFSPKGGVGKTTIAVNLALVLADRGSRQVCVVDLDLAFGDVAITLQLFPTHSIEHAAGGEHDLDFSLLEPLLTRHPDGIAVLAAPSLPDALDRISPSLVTQVLRTLASQFDYVVVDTAPAFDEHTLAALDATDDLVLVATLDVPTLKNVKVAAATLDTLRVAEGRRHLVLNRADDAVGIDPGQVPGILGMPVAARLPSAVAVAAATNAGRPLVLDSAAHPVSEAVRGLVRAVAGEPAVPPGRPTPAPARRRLLRRGS
ncbi:response regulator [Nocardioides lentus]|uniref:Response regulator n=1 Tax=Nocardioides lentus TaxID=338077 RepID=A0ABN2P7S4_9ACTN